MRVVACVGLVMGCLALAGCNHFGKKSPAAAGGGAHPPDSANPFAQTTKPAANDPGPTAMPVSTGTGLLAGQILGGYGSQPPLTYIQVKPAADGNQPAGAPIDVEASKDGYFTIQGLQPGRHYQLIARARDGDRQLAGVSWATPPNPRVVIRLSENFQTPETPAMPPPPMWPGASATGGNAVPPPPVAATPAAPSQPPVDPSWVPVPRPAYNPYGGPPQPAASPPPPDPTKMADGPHAHNLSQPATIPGWTPLPAPTAGTGVPTLVPSCVLTGQQLVNFALNDLTGQPWEYRSHRSRLTLIDFWETHCGPCLRAIPHLNIFQEKYGVYGLNVVGIAYEEGTPEQQARKVERIRGRLRVNYTLLLGGGNGQRCPVRTQFAVRAFPTLVLIDETGRILWRSEGLQKPQLTELDLLLRRRLMGR